MARLYWKGISNDGRIKAISEITIILSKYGTILNFQKFSDVILSLVVEVEPDKVKSLYDSLSTVLSMEGNNDLAHGASGSCFLFMNITFTRGTGDLEIEVPDIPE